MRINKIEIKNFKAFYGIITIDLHNGGHNLLVYGENGTGKSSLAHALKLFLDSSIKNHDFLQRKNIFVTEDTGFIKLTLGETVHEWSHASKPTDTLILDTSKTRGFIDYKGLLETYFIQREHDHVNIFDLLVSNIIANTVNDITKKTFSSDWQAILQAIPKRNYASSIRILQKRIDDFNAGLVNKLNELKAKTSEVLNKFGYDVELEFEYRGIFYKKEIKKIEDRSVILKVKYRNTALSKHHHFLNEAKLSAIALALYFASLLIMPSSDLKMIILDDALIGLDMSNRLPVLDILHDLFPDHQKFILTYDKAWFEIVKQRTQGEHWKYIELYCTSVDGVDVPVYAENKSYINKAKEYLEVNDFRASVAYLRAYFENIIRSYCDDKKLDVKYHSRTKDYKSEDFWQAIVRHKVKEMPILTEDMRQRVELSRSLIMNPLSHSLIAETYKAEIKAAITVIEKLSAVLTAS